MKIERKFSLPESGGIGAPLKLHEGGILEGGHGRPVLRVFPVDNYEFPKEVKDQAKEWHVIKVPLLGQNIGHGEKPDWCGRTSCAMAYNYFQLLQGGNAGERYITHSRAGDPECLLDLRHPGGERAFWLPYDNALPKKGWNTYPAQSYEVQSDYRSYLLANGKPIPLKGEIPLPQQDLFPPPPAVRPLGLGPILRYSAPANLDSYDSVPGHLLPDSMRGQAEEIRNSEKRVRERFAHLVSCLRANNPVVIYTGVGRRHTEKDGTIINPRHIILICGYCILRVGGEDQLWLVTADPSTKRGLVENKQFSVPDPKGLVDLGHPIGASHTLFRMRGGYIAGDRRPDIAAYASFNLVRAKAFFEKNLETVGTDYNLVLDHRDRRGGRYLFREEFTPAPPEVVDSSFSRPRYVFPLRGTTAASSPFERYFNNESLETGVGGYYVLGLQRNLHGGIHLFPPAESRKATPVQAIAPGYVVAARLPGSTAPCRADGVMEALGNWPGFVLVRHELEDLTQPPPPGNQAPPPRAFYTLYMHLSSPAFPGEPEAAAASVPDYFTRVPWFREMYKRRFGAWVNISDTAGGHPLGTMLWSVEPTTASASQAKVLGANGQPQELTVKTAAGQAQWLYKAPPANLTKAVEALEKGKVLTFPEPFFPVAIGDVVGFVAPLPTDPLRDAPRLKIKREQQVDKFEFRSGFLHFQVFAPEADAKSGIKLLAKLANDLELPEEHKSARRTPALPPLTENTEDNFLEVSELEQHLEKSLPQEDQADFHKATHKHFLASQDRKNFGYAKSVIALLDTHTSFAPRAEKPDWKSCTGFEYPLKVEVDVGYLPLPAKNTMIENGSYELELFFEQELDGGTWRRMDCPSQTCGVDLNGRMVCKPASIKLDENKLKGARNGILPLTLMVPATADRLTLKAKQGFTVEQTVPLRGSDGYLFTQGITRRWRNVLLTHKNEWAPDVVRGVLRKVKEELASQSTSVRVTEEQAAQIAWCDAEKEEHVPRVLDNGSDEGDKLFQASGSLPPSGKIENLHPITAVWLLNVLDKQNKARVKSEWPVPDFRKAQPHPLYAGWVKQSGEHRVGGTATAVIIDEDFGYDSKHQIALRMKQGQSVVDLTRGAAASSSGNIVHTVATGFWGDWTLEAVTVPPPGDTSAPKALSPRKRDDRLAADLSVPRPKLVGAQGKEVELREPPRRLPDGSWQWRLDFEKPVPLELSGFMSLRTSKTQDGAAPSYVDAFVPVTARPLQTWTGPEVSRTHFAQENGFIVGLTDEGSNVWRDPKKKLYVVGDLVPYKACFDAMDFPVGWGLVQGLAHLTAKKIAFELLSISETNELSCIVRAANPDKLLEVTTATKKRRREGSKDIELTFGPAVCEDPKQLALWIFDEQRKTVLNCRPAAADVKLGPIPFRKYRSLPLVSPPLHLHTALASALGHVASKLKNKLPQLDRIELNGLGCTLNAGSKAVVDQLRALAASGAFQMSVEDPAQPLLLRLSPNLGTKDSLFLTFNAGRLFNTLAASDLEPGTELFHWFEFTALNGFGLLHAFGAETTGDGDGSVNREKFDALKAKTSQHLRISHEGTNRYRKVGFRNLAPKAEGATGTPPPRYLTFKPAPKPGQCELEISACVAGAPEDLRKYYACVSRKVPGGKKWEPIKGFHKLSPPENRDQAVMDWVISARVPFPPEGEKRSPLDGENGFKVELIALSEEVVPQRLEQEGNYDFTPRWEGGLKVERKGEALELRCHAEGMEVPVPGSKDKSAWAVAREFEVFVETDPAQELPKGTLPLAEHIQYATPTLDGKRGGCDVNGDFVATIDVKAFAKNVSYRFTVRRTLDKNKKPRPVRNTALAPLSGSEPFKLPE